jgi:hypothetical protein
VGGENTPVIGLLLKKLQPEVSKYANFPPQILSFGYKKRPNYKEELGKKGSSGNGVTEQ